MIVYAQREEQVSTEALIKTIIASKGTERLIRLGQLASAIADALCPDQDDDVFCGAGFSLQRAFSPLLPATINIRPPEGYAYYALYPEMYAAATRRFESECHPKACVVIGIRSIGTSLSATVARALACPVWSFTVRPRGHPFDRKINLSPALESGIRTRRDHWFCIVDEGPGLSGSSFTSVAAKLSELGVPDNRIVFFPSHEPDPANFVNESARNRWPLHRRYVEPFRVETIVPPNAIDLSAGKWRDVADCWPPVHPQHERRKYLAERKLWKFAGLAHLGKHRYERGRILAKAGFIPPVLDFCDGFIVSEFVQGRPATQISEQLLEKIACYLAFLRSEFFVNRPVPAAQIEQMIQVNTGIECNFPGDGQVVAIDGRMLPHEWIGLLKTDALDHHDDHFFPGCQDIAWDIAGAAVEFGFDMEALASRYLRITQDTTLRKRLPYYKVAYLSYRIGYCDMAGTPEFAALKERYTAALTGAQCMISTA